MNDADLRIPRPRSGSVRLGKPSRISRLTKIKITVVGYHGRVS